MDVSQEIARQVKALPATMQEQVLRFVASLTGQAPIGERGALLRQFSNSIDAASLRQITEAIEKECERVDVTGW